MNINIDTIHTTTDIPKCLTVQKLKQVMTKADHLQQLREHIIRGWLQRRNELPQEIRLYWTFRDDIGVIHGIILKCRQIIIPKKLQKQALDQLDSNHMGIEKTRFLACKLICWIGINANIETHKKLKQFQQTQPKER